MRHVHVCCHLLLPDHQLFLKTPVYHKCSKLQVLASYPQHADIDLLCVCSVLHLSSYKLPALRCLPVCIDRAQAVASLRCAKWQHFHLIPPEKWQCMLGHP
jgi:hypothetical protein